MENVDMGNSKCNQYAFLKRVDRQKRGFCDNKLMRTFHDVHTLL